MIVIVPSAAMRMNAVGANARGAGALRRLRE